MEKPKKSCECVSGFFTKSELMTLSASSEPSTLEHESHDTDNKQDCPNADKGKGIDKHCLDPKLEETKTPTTTPSSSAENPTPAPTLQPVRTIIRTTEPTYVRALQSSQRGLCFQKGNILRVIGYVQEFTDGSLSFELIRLTPPGESGRAMRGFFEMVDQEAADEVGRRAETEEERATFWRAMEWAQWK